MIWSLLQCPSYGISVIAPTLAECSNFPRNNLQVASDSVATISLMGAGWILWIFLLASMSYLRVFYWCSTQKLAKTYDAIVGDVTILAVRSNMVELAQPFAESGLLMAVPVKLEESA
ncbi:glutamate receptor 2.9 [Euphorbia peplus]|nr:glutamate receptor 2.9 [Euphorbia peplus]